MATDLSAIQDEVAANTSVVGSATALLDRLADELEAAAADPAAVQALAGQIRSDREALAASVAANTPAEGGGENPPPA